jgi:hypothetical protein
LQILFFMRRAMLYNCSHDDTKSARYVFIRLCARNCERGMVLGRAREGERGSAIFILFVAVALFGLLSFAMLQGSRSSLTMISDEAQKNQATQTQDCMNTIDMAAKRLAARGCGGLVSYSEDGSNVNAGAPSDGSCSIYHTNGGGVKPCAGGGGSSPADCSALGDANYNDPISGHCYFRTAGTFTNWNAAETACESDGAYLGVITSGAEQTAVENLPMNEIMYFGIDDIATEGTWRYSFGELSGTQFWSGDSSGSPTGGNHSNWKTGEPNQFGMEEDCGVIGFGGPDWIDYPCASGPWDPRALCEIDGTP